jgi:type I restriction enzyme, S subunit
MRKVRLSDVCAISSGGTPSRNNPEYFKGDIPWAKISDIENADNGVVYATEEHISTEGLKNIRGKLFPKDTLLFAMYGSIGKVGITGRALSTNQAILGVRPRRDDEINLNYLKTWFISNKQKLINLGRGVALKNLSATIVRNLEIELPPFGDQIRIAHLLSKVEGLIAQRKQHLQQLDELLKSVFLEMFGDPVRNEKGWEYDSLANFGVFKNGLNYGQGESGVKVRCLGVGDFKDLSKITNVNCLSTISLSSEPPDDYLLRNADLVFVRSNGNRNLVGRCIAIYPNEERVAFSGFCIRYRITGLAVDATYISHLFRASSFRRLMLEGGQGANIQNINQKRLSALAIPVPHLDIQNQFFVIVEKVESLKIHYQQNLTDLEALYGTLSQQAFKGDLDLSRVPLPAIKANQESAVAIDRLQVDVEHADAINLPDIDSALDTFENTEAREVIITYWLEAYRNQLGNSPFSIQHFMAAAQARVAVLYPDDDFTLDANDYEYIKAWVYSALAAGTLTQNVNEASNAIQIKAVHE